MLLFLSIASVADISRKQRFFVMQISKSDLLGSESKKDWLLFFYSLLLYLNDSQLPEVMMAQTGWRVYVSFSISIFEDSESGCGETLPFMLCGRQTTSQRLVIVVTSRRLLETILLCDSSAKSHLTWYITRILTSKLNKFAEVNHTCCANALLH